MVAGLIPESVPSQAGFRDTVQMWRGLKALEWSEGVSRDVAVWSRQWESILGNRQLSMVRAPEVQRLFSKRATDGRQNSSVNLERKYFHGFWKWAMTMEYVLHDARPGWPRLKEVSTYQHMLLWWEMEAKLVSRLTPLDGKWLLFAARSGLRHCECQELLWDWISEDGVIEVPALPRKQRKKYRLALTPEILEMLGPRGEPGSYVFPGLAHRSTLRWRLQRAAKKVGFKNWENFSPHRLRHSFVARLAKRGVRLEQVKKLGGWASLSVLLKHYYPEIEDGEARDLLGRIQ